MQVVNVHWILLACKKSFCPWEESLVLRSVGFARKCPLKNHGRHARVNLAFIFVGCRKRASGFWVYPKMFGSNGSLQRTIAYVNILTYTMYIISYIKQSCFLNIYPEHKAPMAWSRSHVLLNVVVLPPPLKLTVGMGGVCCLVFLLGLCNGAKAWGRGKVKLRPANIYGVNPCTAAVNHGNPYGTPGYDPVEMSLWTFPHTFPQRHVWHDPIPGFPMKKHPWTWEGLNEGMNPKFLMFTRWKKWCIPTHH